MTALLLSGMSAQASQGYAAELTNLRCEYLDNPLGIDAAHPRLSWVIGNPISEISNPRSNIQNSKSELPRGQRQTAYQVLVASTPELLAADRGDLWDSGKVSSDQSIQIEYAGESLDSERQCHWKVRAWAEGGDLIGKATAWSKPAHWSMGLLSAAAWGGAKWIGDDAPQNIPSPLLRKPFSVDRTVKRAMVYVTAHGAYELRLNGKKVGDHILAPGWTDYRKRILYQTFDVTDMIKAPGENVIGGIIGDGWYNACMFTWPKRGANGSTARALMVKLVIEYADGGRTAIVSDEGWQMCRDGFVRESDIYHGETIDSRKFNEGWDEPGYDTADWDKPNVYPAGAELLVAQQNEPIRVVMDLKPVKTTQPKAGVLIFDMGQNMAGWCRAKLTGPAGTTVTLRHGELLNPDGTLYVANLRGARQQEKFILNGASNLVFEPRFTYHGFRYVEVTGLRDASDLELVGRVFYSDSPITGTFACSNPLLDKIWNNAMWSQRGNHMSVPTDCPQRAERMGWTDNASVYSQTAIFNMDVAAFYAKWVQDIRDSQSEAGGYKNFAPSFETETGAPGWADAGVILPLRLYENYGDTRVTREHFLSMKKYISLIHEANTNHLRLNMVNGSFSDWLDGSKIQVPGYPAGGAIPCDVFATAMYCYVTRAAARMADRIGENSDAASYNALADEIRKAFNDAYVKPTGEIKGNSQAGYALALNFDLLPENLRPEAARRMNDLVVNTYDGRFSTGEHATPRLLLELSRRGYHETACKLVESTRFPSLGYQIGQGATTMWERWDSVVEGQPADPGGNSLNHWMFGAVCEWMYRVVLGIHPDPEQPGYKHFLIKPRPGGSLTWARGGYDSVHGKISSAWKLEAGKLTMDVTVPVNTTATVSVLATDAASVTESGKPAGQAQGVKFLRMADGAALYEIGSGSYHFEKQ
jgi:alpha-L-rhamnosidase